MYQGNSLTPNLIRTVLQIGQTALETIDEISEAAISIHYVLSKVFGGN